MRVRIFFALATAVVVSVTAGALHAPAAGRDGIAHLTVYDAGVAEFLEERTIVLQEGLNTLEWRSLMPKAFLRTVRVTAENADVVRQDVTHDGTEVANQKSPVLHVVLRNKTAAGPRRVRVDYLAPNTTWQNDYSLVLEPTESGAPPTAAVLDSWVSLLNRTGTDVEAGTVDLVAGEIALLQQDEDVRYQSNTSQVAQSFNRSFATDSSADETFPGATSISAFHRFRLGNDIRLNANAPVTRLPLFQGARLRVEQRLVFENAHGAQTLASGGFTLLPRGLEVRLVARNTVGAPMPAGQVTVYARKDDMAQIVGQDRIGHTAINGEFTVAQGRSGTLVGTRRILERQKLDYEDERHRSHDKLSTKVEVVIANRSRTPAEVFIREGIEPYDDNQWQIVESTIPGERLGASYVQFKANVPAEGKTVLVYRVETK